MSAQSLVDEQVRTLCELCELDKSTSDTFRTSLLSVAEHYFASQPVSVSTSVDGGKVKGSKKTRATKVKEEKLSNKNSYHIFVSVKMAEVKGSTPAKERMGAISKLWKELDEAAKAPYKAQADAYNTYIAQAMTEADWKSRKDDIKKAANVAAGLGAVADVEVEDVVEPTPVATPVVAPVATPVQAVVRKATKAKVATK